MFYTYLWLREDLTPYYVGKGRGDRGFTSRMHRFKCPPAHRIILLHFNTEQESFDKEIELIAQFGRKDLGMGCLRNLTDGGDGPINVVVTERTKQKLRQALTGNSNAAGCIRSEEFRRRLSELARGRKHSDEQRRKNSEANSRRIRKPHSAETRQKIKESALRREARKRGLCPTQ